LKWLHSYQTAFQTGDRRFRYDQVFEMLNEEEEEEEEEVVTV
jgi:hypothetical protein